MPPPLNGESLRLAAEALEGRLYGAPQAVRLPQGCPVSAWICAVAPAPGCLPPDGRFAFRLAAGAGFSSGAAILACRLEAVERYSIQFQDGDPDIMRTAEPGMRGRRAPTRGVVLGHPEGTNGVDTIDSRGCSIGLDVADAAMRGLLELLEQDSADKWRDGRDTQLVPVRPPRDMPELGTLANWLAALGREIRFLASAGEGGVPVVLCVCRDASGARVATGSSAGADLRISFLHSAAEAVVAWQNLMMLERKGVSEGELPRPSRTHLRVFRGEQPVREIDSSAAVDLRDLVSDPGPLAAMPPGDRFRELAGRLGREAMVFDLTREQAGIPAVRVILGK